MAEIDIFSGLWLCLSGEFFAATGNAFTVPFLRSTVVVLFGALSALALRPPGSSPVKLW